jgi:predicted HTH transcriptional regulator
MPYVIRDADGKIVQVFDQPVTGKSEQVSADSDDYKRYVDEHEAHSAEELRRQLVASDAGMARLVEDLVDVLINKGIIKFTELPPAAGAKYLERQSVRERLHSYKNLIVEEKDII